MKKYQNMPGFLSICLSVLVMAAGSGVSVGASRTWRREFWFPEEKTMLGAEELWKFLLSCVWEDAKKEKEEPADIHEVLEGDQFPRSREVREAAGLGERKRDKRSAERLNPAFYFDQEEEQEISNSYGARIYKLLSQKDSSWIQGIYSNMETPPGQMAAAQGVDIGDLSHWNRVTVTFRDGDGTPISGYSNAKEILSLASVYGYFQGWEEYDAFLEYALALWDCSHSYQISMSPVYYCESQCQYLEEPEEDSREEGTEEQESADAAGGGQDSGAAREGQEDEKQGSGAAREGREGEEQSSGVAQEGQEGEEQSSGAALEGQEDEEQSSGVAQEGQAGGEQGSGAAQEGQAGGEQDSRAAQEGQAGGGQVGEAAEEGQAGESDAAVSGRQQGQAGDAAPLEGEPGNGSAVTGQEESRENRPAGPGETWEAVENPSDGNQETQDAQYSSGTDEGREAAAQEDSGQENTGQGLEQGGTDSCQGHVDLNISIQITGLKESRSLYEADPVGARESAFDSQWKGWDEEARSSCEALDGQDWYDLYGIASSPSLYVRNPLTQSEIAYYLNKLPAATSQKRRHLVRQALSSVGCIPYYWGGKPSRGGIEGNGFGSIVEADEDGRILKGLDCSGWINWVYWTAFGSPLPAQSTSGLVSCGRGIAKEELRAGDILIRTGEQPHVYLFLAWAEDGSMYLIHETTGYVNNVMIDTYDVELPHYRDLIGEE